MNNKRLIKNLVKSTEKKNNLRDFLYSNYQNSNDKTNWNMEIMDFLIYFEGCLEGLAYKRLYDNKLNDLVMSLIGFIKHYGLSTNTEIKF